MVAEPQAVTNKSRYGNTYTFVLSNHKIECRNGKPVAIDVSLGNVSVQVNTSFVGENPDYYDRRQPKSAPQHILIRLQHGNASLLNSTGIGLVIWRAFRSCARSSGPTLPNFARR